MTGTIAGVAVPTSQSPIPVSARLQAGSARFTVICPGCLRIEFAPDGKFVDEPSVFASSRPTNPTIARADGPPVCLETDRFTLNYRTASQGASQSPTHGLSDLRVVLKKTGPNGEPAIWTPAARQSRNLGGTLSTLDGLRDARPVGHGLLSRDGWFLIDDSDGHLLDEHGWAVCRDWRGYEQAGRIDWYLFVYGDDYAAAMRALAAVCGPVPLPRRSVLGSWYSRYWPHTSDEFRAIANDFDRRGFPLDVMVLDMDWHSGSAQSRWTGWSWNRSLLPDAERLLGWMHDRGLSVCLNLHPAEGVGSWEDRYSSFMRAMGLDPASGERVEFDAGNRRYMEALFEQVLRPLEEPGAESFEESRTGVPGDRHGQRRPKLTRGVDLWWLDWQQEREVRSIPGLTNLAWLNRLFFLNAHRAGQRGTGFSRWAGWGDHRHPIHFSGDAHTGWPMLAFQVPFTVTAGNAGCFFWSHDIGGHFGPRNDEAFTRWVQFGALSAALRLHSARDERLDRLPWRCREPFASAARKAFRLRSALMPTIYTAAAASTRDCTPFLRPLWFDAPHDEHAYRSPDSYLLGEHVLAAPITEPGRGPGHVAERCVWFPRGQDNADAMWADLATGERYRTGRHAFIAAELQEIPVFVRAGAPVVMQAPRQRMTGGVGLVERESESAPSNQELVIRLFAPNPARSAWTFESRLYEDDGESDAFKRGERSITSVIVEWRLQRTDTWELSVTVSGADGTFADASLHRTIVVEFGDQTATVGNIEGGALNRCVDGLSATELPTSWLLRSDKHTRAEPCKLRAVLSTGDHAKQTQRARARRLSARLGLPTDPDRPMSLLHSLAAPVEPDEQAAHAAAWAVATGLGPVLRHVGPCADASVAPPVCVVADPHDVLDADRPVSLDVLDRIGECERLVAGAAYPTPIEAGPAGGEPGQGGLAVAGVLPDEPPIGRLAERLVRLHACVSSRLTIITRIAGERRRPIRAWRVAGPFDWDWRWSIGSHTLPSEGHAPHAAWHKGLSTERWGLHAAEMFPHRSSMCAHGKTVLLSATTQRARLLFQTADKLLVRLNEQNVFTLDDHSGPQAQAMACEVELRQGENPLDVRLTHGWNDWGVNVFVDAARAVEELDPFTQAPMPAN